MSNLSKKKQLLALLVAKIVSCWRFAYSTITIDRYPQLLGNYASFHQFEDDDCLTMYSFASCADTRLGLCINPASDLPLVGDSHVDTAGNPLGCDFQSL